MSKPRSGSIIISWLNQLIVRSGLTSSRAIRWQLAVLLHFTRIDELAAYHYERRFKRQDSATMPPPRVASFPRVSNFMLRYQTFSTAFLVPCFIKYTFPEHLNRLLVMLYDSSGDGKLAGLPPACVVPGRYIFHKVLRNQFGLVFSGFNLFYRFYIWYAQKSYTFGLIDALIQEEHELDNFYRLLETETSNLKSTAQSGRRIASHPFSQFMCYQVEHQAPGKSRCLKHKRECGEQSTSSYRLRPNMTRQVCARYKLYIAYSFLFVCLTLGSIALVLGSFFVLVIILDWGYLYDYPSCNEHLEQLYDSNQLPWYSITLTPHRCVMIVFDLIENVVMWVDSGLTVFGIFALLIVLNNHVLCHWHLLHKRIVLAVGQMRTEHHQPGASSGAQLAPRRYCCKGTRGGGGGGGGVTSASQHTLTELKAGMRDFFEQVAHMDVLASDIMSASFLMWLVALLVTTNRAFSYYLKHPDFFSLLGFTFPTVFLAAMPFAAAPSTIVSFIMFGLNTNCIRTYSFLCALVAYQEPRIEKNRFSDELMEYFVHQDKICYRILGTYPFKASSYFKLVSWAATLLALQASMIHH